MLGHLQQCSFKELKDAISGAGSIPIKLGDNLPVKDAFERPCKRGEKSLQQLHLDQLELSLDSTAAKSFFVTSRHEIV